MVQGLLAVPPSASLTYPGSTAKGAAGLLSYDVSPSDFVLDVDSSVLNAREVIGDPINAHKCSNIPYLRRAIVVPK